MLSLICSVILLCSVASSRLFRPEVVDEKNAISYVGIQTERVEQFLSIRYGADTSGEYRFKPPRPHVYEKGSRIDVTKEGPACPQLKYHMPGDPHSVEHVSEDCLFLRIARPKKCHRDKLPVMVWIHGGGHMVGSIYDVLYNPVGLVNNAMEDGNPAIYVALNHRLNIFGYPLSDAAMDGSDGTATNLGLRDQRLALQWIKDHIEVFGGDPETITVFGEDTGASDIGFHIAKADGLFQRAIAQSGSALSPWAIRHQSSYDTFAKVTRKLGCISDSPEAWNSLSCLRQRPMEQILNITFQFAWKREPIDGLHVFGPAYDYWMVGQPGGIAEVSELGKSVDYMTGWNMDEVSTQIPTSLQTIDHAAAWLGQRYPQLIEPLALALLSVYKDIDSTRRCNYHENVSTAWCATARAVRDIEITCPSISLASRIFDTNGGASSVFMYELNQTAFAPMLQGSGKAYLGVVHFSDVPYVFNELETSYHINESKELELAAKISATWAKFAATGFPGGSSTWPEALKEGVAHAKGGIDERHIALKVLGGPNHGPREMAFEEKKRCQYVNGIAHFFQPGEAVEIKSEL